jgi:hypothetical protein
MKTEKPCFETHQHLLSTLLLHIPKITTVWDVTPYSLVEMLPIFQRNTLPLPSGSKSKPSKPKMALLVWFTLWPWRWEQYVPPKHSEQVCWCRLSRLLLRTFPGCWVFWLPSSWFSLISPGDLSHRRLFNDTFSINSICHRMVEWHVNDDELEMI